MRKQILPYFAGLWIVFFILPTTACATKSRVRAIQCDQLVNVNRKSNDTRKERLHLHDNSTEKRLKKIHSKQLKLKA